MAVRLPASLCIKIETETMIATRKLIESLLALAGIWLLFRQLPDYASTLYIMLQGSIVGSPELIGIQSIHFFASVFFGAVLISARKFISRWLVREENNNQFQSQALVSVGVAIVSVFFVLSGVTELGQYYGVMQESNASNPYPLWKGIFSIASGLVAFVFSVGIGRVWSLLRGHAKINA